MKAIKQATGARPTRTSAGVIVVRRAAGRWRFLLLRAFRYWDFPKGMVEEGEEPLAAARREVEEETGITELDFRWGTDYRETEPYNRAKVARYYIAETSQSRVVFGINPLLGRPEHHEYRWADEAQAQALVSARVAPILAWALDLIKKPAKPG